MKDATVAYRNFWYWMRVTKPVAVLAFIVLLIMAACFFCGLAGNVVAQEPCAGQVQPALTAVNIRPQRNTTSTPIGRIFAGTSAPAQGATQGWHALCSGTGYVSADVARFSTNTPAATRTPLPQLTPTAIAHNMIWCSDEPKVTRVRDAWFVECTR